MLCNRNEHNVLVNYTLKTNKQAYKQFIEKEIRFVITKSKGCGEGELDEGGQQVLQNSGSKINKY